MGTWLRRLFVGMAAACVLLLGGLLLVEESGVLARYAREALARELGPLGKRLRVEHVELSWFEPGIDLVGLSLPSLEPAGVNILEIHRLHATLSPRLDRLLSLRVEGGQVLVGQQLFDDWNALAADRSRRGGEGQAPRLPKSSITGVRVAIELFDDSRFDLGTLDLCARPGSGGVELAGRLAPSLGGAITSPEPIRVNGTLSEESVRLWASARDLALESQALPNGALTRQLPLVEGSARLTLDSDFELVFADSARPRGYLRASLVEGHALVREGLPSIDDLALELEADLAPQPGSDPWTRESWDGRVSLHARIEETPLWVWGEFGRNVPLGNWLRAWGRARGVAVDRGALEALGLEEPSAFVREMLDPSGRVDLAGTLGVSRKDGGWKRDLALHASADGTVGLRYMGYPGDPASGVPLPLSGARGEFLIAERTHAARPWRMCGFDLSAEHGSGLVRAWTQITAPHPAPSLFSQPEMDLVLSTPSIAVNRSLEEALAQNHNLTWIVPDFAPQNGSLSGEFRLRSGAELGGTSGAGTIRLHGLSLRWADVPVPMDGVDGELGLRWAAKPSIARDRPLLRKRPIGVTYRLDNSAGRRVGAQARISGWVREAPVPSVFDPASLPEKLMQEIRIEIDELGLRGRDFDILSARFPPLEKEVKDYGAVGRMSVRFRGAQPALGVPFRSEIEAAPIEVHVRPEFFQRQTRDLRGRILIQTEERGQEEVSASQFVLTGAWPGGVELFTRGTIPEVGLADVQVYGAGIDPTNTSFKGALITSLTTASPTTADIDISSWTLEGRMDFALETTFDPASAAPAENRYRLQLRGNDLIATDIILRDMHGTFEQEGEVLSSPLILARLGGHPVELRNVLTFPLAALPDVSAADPWLSREGFWKDPLGRALQADIHTRDLALDAEHLEGLLEPAALEELRHNPNWRGALDILGARIVVTSELDNQGRVALRGAVRPHDMDMRLGLPIHIETADVELEELIHESGRFRGWARIDGLSARIAERELSDASMIAGYVDGRLTIDNLSGSFEGGRLESIGGALGGTSKALGIDLAEPHHFDVAMRMQAVNVGGLLRGVFQSSIADEGILNASLQLSGTPGEVLALTGRGRLELDEGALWSIPVMRALFARLGFDKSGLFDRLHTRFELREGRIQVSRLEIRSSLLDLVGEGWQDLDGRLAYDLEVRYGLLDRLGPFGRLLYWLNNNLMRVAVRGDFERPEVKIRNSLLELISTFEETPPRRLPLPDFSALGTRF